MPTHAIPMPPLSHRQCQQAETIIHTDQQTQDSLQQTSALLLETKNLLSQQRADYYDRSRQTALANEARVASLQEAVERLQMEVSGCDECKDCQDGWCRSAFKSRSGAIYRYLCEARTEEVGGRVYTFHNWECVSGTCDDCGFGTDKAPKRPPLFDCPHIRAVEAAVNEAGHTREEEAARGRIKIPMRKYITRAQKEEVLDEERGQRWDAAEVGRDGEKRSKVNETEGLEVQYLSIDDAMQYIEEVLREYILHDHKARHQSKEFQRCRDKLRTGQIMIIGDFAMNYGHHHQDGLQGDHWGVWQTTILPFVIYRRGKDGRLLLESYVVYSDDLNHSNKFVQHAIAEVVRHYQVILEVDSVDLTHVFMWSDGCAAQFKSRHMMRWYAVESADVTHQRNDGSKVCAPLFRHEFFASCHGKNLCDAMAGFIKGWIKRREDRSENYYRYTTDLQDFFTTFIDRKPEATAHTREMQDKIDSALQATAADMETYGRLKFSTIVSQYIPRGTVKHVHYKDGPKIPHIMSYHSFIQLPGPENKGKVKIGSIGVHT